MTPALVGRSSIMAGVVVSTALLSAAAFVGAPSARGDVVGYLVNVTVRPGYGFANAQEAIAYGQGICEKVAQGRTYAQIMTDVRTDFGVSDEYQASYLVTQAVNELCPASIWQLRMSAAGYQPPSA